MFIKLNIYKLCTCRFTIKANLSSGGTLSYVSRSQSEFKAICPSPSHIPWINLFWQALCSTKRAILSRPKKETKTAVIQIHTYTIINWFRERSQQRIGFRYSVWELLVLLRREFKMHTLQEQQCESLTLEKNQTLYKAENSQGCGHRSHGDIIWHNFKSVLTWAKGNRWEHTHLWEVSRPSRSEWFWIE